MRKKHHKIDGLGLAVKGFIAFNKFGDVWMGSHSEERLREFMEQQPWLKLEPEIHPISSRLDEVRIIKPDQLKEKHADTRESIPSPPAKKQKARKTLPYSAIDRSS